MSTRDGISVNDIVIYCLVPEGQGLHQTARPPSRDSVILPKKKKNGPYTDPVLRWSQTDQTCLIKLI